MAWKHALRPLLSVDMIVMDCKQSCLVGSVFKKTLYSSSCAEWCHPLEFELPTGLTYQRIRETYLLIGFNYAVTLFELIILLPGRSYF